MTLAEFLAHIKRLNKSKSRNRIETADRYLATLAKCSGGLCPTDRARYTGPEFDRRVKELAQIPVYKNDAMNFIAWTKSGLKAADGQTVAPCASFEAIYTSNKQDRDSDILEPSGAELDPKMPVLWQHDPTAPIGAHRETLTQDKMKIMGRAELADTVLGRDAAYLAEFGALRISHGFRPREFQPIMEKQSSASKEPDVITGFHVTKYEMMEISLVSVPSNTDAVIEAFHRSKLASPLAKSWGKSLDERRQRFFTTSFGVKAMKLPAGRMIVGIKRIAKTGNIKPLKNRKDAADFESALADTCSKIVHSGDYGLCFYKAGGTDGTYSVWWTSADSDDPSNNNEEGQPYTSSDDIKSLLGAVAGVSDVEIQAESNPPYDEGWREVYPDVRDWTTQGADKPQGSDSAPAPSADSSPIPPADDTGKGKKPGRRKLDAPVSGSAEHVASTLEPLAQDYLTQAGIAIQDGQTVEVEATYPDSVILDISMGDEEGDHTYYRVAYTLDDSGNATFSGPPEQVEFQTVATEPTGRSGGGASGSSGSGTADSGTGSGIGTNDGGGTPNATSATAAGKKPVAMWVLFGSKPVKGKLGKKDSSSLKEAAEHLDDAMKRDGMPTVCKTLVKRGYDLINDVMKSDGVQDGAGGSNGQAPAPQDPPTMNAGERRLWALVIKLAANPKASKTALAALLSELASTLEASDVSALLATLHPNT